VDDDSDGSQERDDDEGTMRTTNDCSGRGRRNTEGRWNQNIIATGRRRRWHHGKSRRLPPRPDVGRHHSREKGCGSETLLSCGIVYNDDDSANDDGRYRMNVTLLINKQRNACFRRTDAMRIHVF
jgi:hypothetical protein